MRTPALALLAPSRRTVTILAPAFFALTCVVLSASARAQDRAVPMAQRALDTIDPAACRPTTLAAGVVRLAIVVHPDGAWALAIGPISNGEPPPAEVIAAFRACLESALAATLPTALARPPRAVSAVARTWTVPSIAEAWVDQRLAALGPAIEECAFRSVGGETREIRARLRIERGADGRAHATPTPVSPAATLLAGCVARMLGPLPGDLLPMERDVVTQDHSPPIETPTEPHDGRAGAICRWGERRPEAMRLPAPRACRAGLTCCASGGAGGSDSVCMRIAGHCPMYP